MTYLLNRIRPAYLLRLQSVVVAVMAAVIIVVFLFALNLVRDRLQESSDKGTTALLSFRVHDELSRSLDILGERADTIVDGETSADRAELRRALFTSSPAAARLDLPVTLSIKEVASLQSSYDALRDDARHLYEASPDAANAALVADIESLQVPLNLYLNDPTALNFQRLYASVAAVENHARMAIPNLVGEANDEDMSLQQTVERGGFAILGGLVAFAAVLIVVTVSVSERVRLMYEAAEQERTDLRQTTSVLQHRNEQMNALYTVFTEITDTLSLRYVVNATLREALKLMNCQAAVLRLLKDGHLVIAGTLAKDGSPVDQPEQITLDIDPVGRVAKRGRPLRIGSHNQDLLNDQNREAGMHSGLIIPLILGARVVGTLSVWSRETDAFTEEDERILGMMGSQVATAVVAADTTEASEHRAHHDPLTGLPNRLQLMEDMVRDFNLLQMADRQAVVGMIDIDHFKHFNDDFGHHVGDVSLQKVALTLRQSLRENDRVYRYGGEEFVIVLMDIGGDEARALAERLRSAIEGTPLKGEQLEPVDAVTISMGLAFYPEDGKEFGSLIEVADLAMYRAKSLGRNQIATWSDDIVSHAA